MRDRGKRRRLTCVLHVISLIHEVALVASLDVARLKEQFVKIAIVTDSTCDWALDEFARRNVEMVPLKICFSNESFADQIEISTDEFYDRMIDAVDLPSTSQPSPHDFAKLFERLAEEGYEGAVCLHIALPLSGTPQVAGIAGADAPLDVRVIDTRCATAPLGLMVDAACELRDSGASLDDMCEKLVAFRDATRTVLVPDSLDNLVRGGRFPEEAAKQASVLNMRMMLTFNEEDGKVGVIGKSKGAKGAIRDTAAFIENYAAEHGRTRLRLVHCRNPKAVETLIDTLTKSKVDFEVISIDPCGATIATHLGIGAFGVAMAPAARCE